jgi:hypothetical protein
MQPDSPRDVHVPAVAQREFAAHRCVQMELKSARAERTEEGINCTFDAMTSLFS